MKKSARNEREHFLAKEESIHRICSGVRNECGSCYIIFGPYFGRKLLLLILKDEDSNWSIRLWSIARAFSFCLHISKDLYMLCANRKMSKQTAQ